MAWMIALHTQDGSGNEMIMHLVTLLEPEGYLV